MPRPPARGGGAASGRKAAGLTRAPLDARSPYAMRWQDLKDLFKQAGYVVRADIAEEEGTKRSKGYGTVCFESADSAQKAIAMFNDMEYEGRMLSVKLDKFA